MKRCGEALESPYRSLHPALPAPEMGCKTRRFHHLSDSFRTLPDCLSRTHPIISNTLSLSGCRQQTPPTPSMRVDFADVPANEEVQSVSTLSETTFMNHGRHRWQSNFLAAASSKPATTIGANRRQLKQPCLARRSGRKKVHVLRSHGPSVGFRI